jgi:glycosyl hydrolase family 65
MSRRQARPISPSSIVAACLAGALAADIVLATTQSLLSPQLTGEAAPPASVLSLCCGSGRRPPIIRSGRQRPTREPRGCQHGVGTRISDRQRPSRRHGFGGVVHERLQLNEDTLWAGRPYDPVNPEAKGVLPAVRRLLAERKYAEAAKLVVMSKPLAQMPYETVGDLALTFPEVDSVEQAYRTHTDPGAHPPPQFRFS